MATSMTDRELLEAAWRLYADRFADHVGDVVTPEEHAADEDQVGWVAQVFMFAYGLGAIAGGHAAAPDAVGGAVDRERVEDVVDVVTDIHGSEAFEASAARVEADLRS